jgi:hypothetical protein
MNNTHAYTRKDDVKEVKHLDWGADIENILGVWINTNSQTGHIAKVEILEEGELFYMHAHGAGLVQGELVDWGRVKCEVYYSDISSKSIAGLEAQCDFGFMETKMSCLIKYGILVIQTYNTFKDNSNRSNYFLREFFRQ